MYRSRADADGPASPQEHARVPGDPGLALELLGPGRVGLLLEAAQRIRLESGDRLAAVCGRQQVAVLGGRAVGLHAERHERVVDAERAGREVVRRGAQDVAEGVLAFDGLVGRQHDHDLVGRAVDGERRQGDGGGRVAPERLEQEGRVGELVADHRFVATVGDDRDVVGQRAQARGRRLEQGLGAEQRKEGLGPLGPAEWVQPRPTTTGHDHAVHAPLILGAGRGPPTPVLVGQSETSTYLRSQMTLRVFSW